MSAPDLRLQLQQELATPPGSTAPVLELPRYGLYDTVALAEDPILAWSQQIAARLAQAVPASPEGQLFATLREAIYRQAPEPERLTVEVRRELYGQRGEGTRAELMLEGLRHFHDALRERFEAMPPEIALVEALRCYGDFLTYFHPEGQQLDGPPWEVYRPFTDLLDPRRERPPAETEAEAEPRVTLDALLGPPAEPRARAERAARTPPGSPSALERLRARMPEQWGVPAGMLALFTGIAVSVGLAVGKASVGVRP